MTVFMGSQGGIELRRFIDGDDPISGVLLPEDVHLDNNSFNHPFHTPAGPAFTTEVSPFITGDRVRVERYDKKADGSFKKLLLVKGRPLTRTLEFYVAVGIDGRLQCYDRFEDAIMKKNRLELIEPPEPQSITMIPVEGVGRCLGNVTSYEFTTDRQTIDVTCLGKEFRDNYTRGLIGGQGSLTCFWDFKPTTCLDDFLNEDTAMEYSQYMLELAQRVTYGADFLGIFYLYKDGGNRSVWQEAICSITNASMAVSVGEVITSKIDFVTNGSFTLQLGQPRFELLLETGAVLKKEDGGDVLKEEPKD